MKMLEWLGMPRHVLRDAYLDAAAYLVPREDAERFIALFRELTCADANGNGSRELLARGRYDSLQMAKHLLAVYGRVVNEANYKPGKITLLNCVWELTDPTILGRHEPKYLAIREEEHEGFARFAELSGNLVAPLFEARGAALSVEYVTACEFADTIAHGNVHKEKLARYIL